MSTPAQLGYVACTRCGCLRPLEQLQGTKCRDTEFCNRTAAEGAQR